MVAEVNFVYVPDPSHGARLKVADVIAIPKACSGDPHTDIVHTDPLPHPTPPHSHTLSTSPTVHERD